MGLSSSVQSNLALINTVNETVNKVQTNLNGTMDSGFSTIGMRIDALNNSHTQDLTDLRGELEKMKAELVTLKTILGAGGTQFDEAPANATAQQLPIYLRKGAIITFFHDLGAALGVAIIFYYLIHSLIFMFQNLSFKLHILDRVYPPVPLSKEERENNGIICCLGEYRRYRAYDMKRKDNLEHGISITELLKSQRILRKLV